MQKTLYHPALYLGDACTSSSTLNPKGWLTPLRRWCTTFGDAPIFTIQHTWCIKLNHPSLSCTTLEWCTMLHHFAVTQWWIMKWFITISWRTLLHHPAYHTGNVGNVIPCPSLVWCTANSHCNILGVGHHCTSQVYWTNKLHPYVAAPLYRRNNVIHLISTTCSKNLLKYFNYMIILAVWREHFILCWNPVKHTKKNKLKSSQHCKYL